MPKIKDLGINAIPLTMQPPAIGGGGGGGGVWSDQYCEEKKEQAWSDQPDCDPNKPAEECEWSGKPKPTDVCEWSVGGAGGKKATGFTPEAIAQLRHQIANQSASL